ncbi:MAG: GNAT family N-acetyltransferase [Gaiellaceae bacterium]
MEARRIALTDGVVVLDRFRAEDEAAHLAGEDEEQARRFGWWPKRSGPAQFRRMLVDGEAAWQDGGPRLKLAARVDGTLVGGCELRLTASGPARVSYWTFPEHRHRGYASRSLRLLAEWPIGELGVKQLEAHIEPDNLASLGAARRAGFRPARRRMNSDGLLVLELAP